MTVGVFFRDASAGAVSSRAPPSRAKSLVLDFFVQYDYADCSPEQLLALADLAVRSRQHDVARTALERVLRSEQRQHLAHYKLGRLDLAADDYQVALRHFHAGIAADSSFPFNWLGAARAHYVLGDVATATDCAERFVAFGVGPHGTEDLPILTSLADLLFEANYRRRSLPLYQLIAQFGKPTPRSTVRLAEGLIASQDFAAGLAVLRPLEAAGTLDIWGQRAFATCLSHCGEHAKAGAVAEAVVLARPTNAGFVAAYVDVLARSRDAAQIRAALVQNSSLLDPEGLLELQARLHLLTGEIAEAVALLAASEIPPKGRRFYLCVETCYAALGAELPALAQGLVERLEAIAPEELVVNLLRVDICFRDQNWEQAGRLLQGAPREFAEQPQLLLKRFEHACFLRQFDEALMLWQKIEALGLPTKQFMLPRFRFLAEQKRWDEIVEGVNGWIDTSFNYSQIGYLLFRAAKHTGRQAELIAAVEAVDGWAGSRNLVHLRGVLALDRAATLDAIDILSRDPTIIDDPVFRRKLEARRGVVARATGRRARRAIFLCSDRNYLCATIVALHTATRMVDKASVDIFLVVDDDLAETATGILRIYVDAGYSLTIVPASQVVDAAEGLYPSYGHFTSGHMLASAAYYRIYFAKYLRQLGTYERAVYVDSDILLRRPVEILFDWNLHGMPVAARLEALRPEVRRAIALHRITDDRYFNSGVLVFDLTNDLVIEGLDGAVAAIGNPETTLMYHDQCALNLGFRDRFIELDRTWNFPIGEATVLADVPEDAAILHFLDRPKPWSAAYGGECGTIWLQAWSETASFMGAGAALALFGLNND